MRKVIVTEFVSLDGVMEDPAWTMPFFNDEYMRFKLAELQAVDAHLLGRVTYEGFAAAWPGRTDEQGFADRMNTLPKYVVSTTLRELTWNNSHLLGSDLTTEIMALKAQPGQDILVAGSAQLVQALMKLNLIDEYRLMTFPVVLGRGKRLFQEGSQATLHLVDSVRFSNGVMVHTYRPTPQ
jgi:dihydrofolate reductase